MNSSDEKTGPVKSTLTSAVYDPVEPVNSFIDSCSSSPCQTLEVERMGTCCGKTKVPADPEATSIENDLLLGKKPVFWVIGGPGSGKGTQCYLLSMRYQLAHLSTGEILRAEVASGSELGKQIQTMVAVGQLVPRDVVLDLLKGAMVNAYPNVKGFLIDGYPREVIQGEEFLTRVGPCTKLIYFECSDETMKKRLAKRAEYSGRADDDQSVVDNRLRIFHNISEAVVRSYSPLLYTINADRDKEKVFSECCALLDMIIGPGEGPMPSELPNGLLAPPPTPQEQE